MLKVYLDDTGNGDQAVGGCVASTEAWRGFETSWRKALTEFSLTWFHAVDFENRRPDSITSLIRNGLTVSSVFSGC
jgi:hypothetical protein